MAQAREYQGICFSYSDTMNDLVRMRRLAAPFLAPGGDGVLAQCYNELRNVQYAKAGNEWEWCIRETRPIRTKESHGGYRDSGKESGVSVYGLLCFTWSIVNPEKGQKQQRHFHLVGRASTSILVKRTEDDDVVAQWQFEAGDGASPGCHFHSAVNQYGQTGLFPEWLKVPRFPGLLLCPLDGLEFLLGELFQRDWHQRMSEDSHDKAAWGNSQKKRLQRVLKWELEQVDKWKTTPWMTLKKAKPPLRVITG